MPKLDITKNNLPVREYINTARGNQQRRFIPFQKPRFSDAFVFILNGSCKYTFDDGTEFEAKKDGVLYLAKDAVYQMDINCDRYEYFVLNFNFASDEKRQSAFYTLLTPASCEQLFSRLCYSRDILSTSAFAKNMGLLYRIIEAINESAERAYIGGEARGKIEKSADRIHEHFADERLSVAWLAESAGMSEVYFRKLFALRFGLPPSRYIMQTRIANAINLMRFEKLSLEEIAEESGFSSLPYFSKVFKSFMGEPPASYRRSLPIVTDIT